MASNSYAGISMVECHELLKTGWLNFDRDRKMPNGPFKGHPLSYSTPAPPLLILSESQTAALPEPLPEGHFAVSNFMAQQGPSLAVIPHIPPRKVTLVSEMLSDGTSHLLLRLVYDNPDAVHFWPQSIDGLAGERITTNDIVIEYGNQVIVGDEHVPYSPVRALGGRYALQSRAGTTAFKVRMTRREGREITELVLNLTNEQKVAVISGFMARTDQINGGEMYHTVMRNCVTEIKDLFVSVGIIKPDESFWGQIRHEFVSWRASGLIGLLVKHEGLIVGQERPVRLKR